MSLVNSVNIKKSDYSKWKVNVHGFDHLADPHLSSFRAGLATGLMASEIASKLISVRLSNIHVHSNNQLPLHFYILIQVFVMYTTGQV